jgi:hypothetical protein
MTKQCDNCRSDNVEPEYPWGHRDGPVVGWKCTDCGWEGVL